MQLWNVALFEQPAQLKGPTPRMRLVHRADIGLEHSGKKERNILWASILFAWLAVLALLIITFRSTSITNEVIQDQLQLGRTEDRLVYLDQALTTSAFMAVYSEVPDQWLARYQASVLEFRQEFEKLARFGRDRVDLRPLASEMEKASDPLFKMEAQTFALLEQGKIQSARKLLSSPEYQAEKKAFADSAARIMSYLEQQLALSQRHSEIQVLLALSVGFCLIPIALLSLAAFRSSQREQKIRYQMISSARMAALGEMASGIAHEVNNPLTVVSSRAELLELSALHGNVDPQRVARETHIIKETALLVGTIIRSLLMFARGDPSEKVVRVPVRKLVHDALSLCRNRFYERGIELREFSIPADWAVECRPMQMTEAFINLLNNAYDAVENSRIRVVEIQASKLEGGRLEIAITDSGPGIPPDLRQKIMQPFFTTKASGRGTGLGLSFAQGIIQSHGGTLQLDSASKNTRFVIVLPLVETSMEKLQEDRAA